jgi:hypothetical protein
MRQKSPNSYAPVLGECPGGLAVFQANDACAHPEFSGRVAMSGRDNNNDRLEQPSIRWLSNGRLSATESMTGMSTINSH